MLGPFYDTPLITATQVDRNDYFTGDGVTKTFTLLNKAGARLGNIIQAGNDQFIYANGGFTKSGDSFTLPYPPAIGTIIIAPGINRIRCRAYAQAAVVGVVDPNVSVTRVIVADPFEIGVNSYSAPPTLPGIRIQMPDEDIAFGLADPTWFELAPGILGGPGSYEAPGDPLYMRDINFSSMVAMTALAGATTLTVVDGSGFAQSDFIQLSPGTGSQEEVYVQNVFGNNLQITPLAFNHVANEPVYHCGYDYYVRMTVPTDTGGPFNLFDIATDVLVDILIRS